MRPSTKQAHYVNVKHDGSIAIQAKALLELRARQNKKRDLSSYKDDPVGFCLEVLKADIITADQKAILTSLLENAETNVQAANGQGKTYIAACAVLWWVYAVGGIAITTAPTHRQVRYLLWGEVRSQHGRHHARLGGTCLDMSVKLTETAMAYGFTAKSNNVNAFQGIHAERLLAIQDEANGISPEIDEAYNSCLTGDHNRALRIGNPTHGGTPFYKNCQQGNIKISAWGHPNIAWAYGADRKLKPDVRAAIIDSKGAVRPQKEWPENLPRERIPGAVSVRFIEKARTKYGESSGYWQARINAEFPMDNTDALIPRSWVYQAIARYEESPEAWEAEAEKYRYIHALDVGDGGDPHATATRRGPILIDVVEYQTVNDRLDVNRGADICMDLLRRMAGHAVVDQIGVGAGALARMLEKKANVSGINFGAAANDLAHLERVVQDNQYANIRAAAYWNLRELLRLGLIVFKPGHETDGSASGYTEKLIEELTAIKWLEKSNGKIQIEAKDDIRARLGRSTNMADTVAMAFFESPRVAGQKATIKAGGRAHRIRI